MREAGTKRNIYTKIEVMIEERKNSNKMEVVTGDATINAN